MGRVDAGASRRPAGSTTSRRWPSPASSTGWSASTTTGQVVRPALLWNDTRSADAAADLIAELGEGDDGPAARPGPTRSGSVPVASFTVTKLRWLADHEPESATRTAAVCLPHDWLTWKLSGASSLGSLVTDRSDASGTGYWSPAAGTYRLDLLTLALGHDVVTPRVLGPRDLAGRTAAGALLGPGRRRQRRRRSRARGPRRRRRGVRRDLGRRVRRLGRAVRRPVRARWPASPTRPATSCPWWRP